MKLPVLLAAAALAVCLTGCSHAQTDATPSATSETAGAAATATPAATPATSAEPVFAEVGTILPETADAGRSYVDETLFIGDSNTARYLLYANETGTAFTSLNNNIGVVSMGVGSITSLKCEKFKGSSAMYTVPDAVAMLKAQAYHHLLRHQQPVRLVDGRDELHKDLSARVAGHPDRVALL